MTKEEASDRQSSGPFQSPKGMLFRGQETRNTSKNRNQLRYFEEAEQKISRYAKHADRSSAPLCARFYREISDTTTRRAPATDRKILLGAPQWSEQRSPNCFITLSLV